MGGGPVTAIDTTTSLEQAVEAIPDVPGTCQCNHCAGDRIARWFGIPPCGHALAMCNACRALRLPTAFIRINLTCCFDFPAEQVRWEPIS